MSDKINYAVEAVCFLFKGMRFLWSKTLGRIGPWWGKRKSRKRRTIKRWGLVWVISFSMPYGKRDISAYCEKDEVPIDRSSSRCDECGKVFTFEHLGKSIRFDQALSLVEGQFAGRYKFDGGR